MGECEGSSCMADKAPIRNWQPKTVYSRRHKPTHRPIIHEGHDISDVYAAEPEAGPAIAGVDYIDDIGRFTHIKHYNTLGDKLYHRGGIITLNPPDTVGIQVVQLPIVMLKNGMAQCVELVKFEYFIEDWEYRDGIQQTQFIKLMDADVVEPGTFLNSDVVYAQKSYKFFYTIGAGQVIQYELHHSVDLSDNSGRGVEVTSNLQVHYTCLNFTSQSILYYKLWYKIVTMETSAFVGIRSSRVP